MAASQQQLATCPSCRALQRPLPPVRHPLLHRTSRQEPLRVKTFDRSCCYCGCTGHASALDRRRPAKITKGFDVFLHTEIVIQPVTNYMLKKQGALKPNAHEVVFSETECFSRRRSLYPSELSSNQVDLSVWHCAVLATFIHPHTPLTTPWS